MKLIGSLIEEEYRAELLKGHDSLFKQKGNKKRLLAVIKKTFPDMQTAYVLDWIPEQGEDIYTILVNVDSIAEIEVPMCNNNTPKVIRIIAVSDFQRYLRKHKRIKLSLGLEMASKDLGDHR